LDVGFCAQPLSPELLFMGDSGPVYVKNDVVLGRPWSNVHFYPNVLFYVNEYLLRVFLREVVA
jgi:hypothetical protein